MRKELEGCPRLLRTDPGTENGAMAAIQCCLRASDEDELAGEKAHRYGSSTGNQCIECWWSHLKRSRTSWWKSFQRSTRQEIISKWKCMSHAMCFVLFL